MATEILMPKQGNTVESCLLLEWKKQEGEQIKAGEVLCDVETDKAAFEVESEVEGTILKLLYPRGADVPVLTPIAVVGQPGENIDKWATHAVSAAPAPKQTTSTEATLEKSVIVSAPPSAPVAAQTGSVGMSPRARNLAAAKGLDPGQLRGTGPEGRIIERDVLAALTDKAPLTPAAIAALIEQGKQAPAVGTGIGGRITASDLVQAQPAPVTQVQPPVAAEFPGPTKSLPVKGVRKVIATRMLESLQTTAQLTLNTSANAITLMAYRKRLKESPETLGLAGITINDLVLFAVARTLPQFPSLNAHFLGESITEFERVHLGLAVDTPRGLLVPVIRNANQLSLKALAQEAKRLAKACQEGKAQPDELTGATFTVTNLGALGIESFTPVLNPPEVGILGVCAIQPKPVMAGDDVTFAPHIGLSLTFDHRAVDGAPAARFLKELTMAIANIDLLLVG